MTNVDYSKEKVNCAELIIFFKYLIKKKNCGNSTCGIDFSFEYGVERENVNT